MIDASELINGGGFDDGFGVGVIEASVNGPTAPAKDATSTVRPGASNQVVLLVWILLFAFLVLTNILTLSVQS